MKSECNREMIVSRGVVTFEYPCSWVGVRTGQVLALQPGDATLSVTSHLHNRQLQTFLRFLYRIAPTDEFLAMDDEKAKAEKLAAAKKRVCVLFETEA